MATAEFVYWRGIRVTPYMAFQLSRLDHDIYNAFGVRIVAKSGIRFYSEQEEIFRRRYVTAGNVRGRKVYDTRWWKGQLWYRIDKTGTVAQPGTSNHEIQGTNAAVDIADSGSDAGIMTKTSKRGRWLRSRVHLYDMEAEGDNFAEGWHYKMKNIYKTPPTAPAGGASKPSPALKNRRKKMSVAVIHTTESADSKRSGAIIDWEAGTWSPFGWFTVAYANGVAKGHGLEQSGPVTRAHYNQIKKDVAKRAADLGKIFVDIADEDVPQVKA